MLISPKWQTMWMESQHCSKSVTSVPLPSQQAKIVLEDLRTNCSSPNKVVQLEALKCWGIWIKNQNSDDWKLKTVCFAAVRPLITRKMQPLNKDVDICKLKLSLMWALLVKVQNLMQLEGPQYILDVFLQFCLTWLSSASEDQHQDEVSVLIFQLLLSVLKGNEILNDCDKEMFTPLSTDILHHKKVFHCVADKFLNIFIHCRTFPDKKIFMKVWKYFLEHCELSSQHIPVGLWHKVFKLTDQICSEKNKPLNERLAFLHCCATTLKTALSSSKFIDFGNLLTTPCEAFFKKLVELCTVECTEYSDPEIFFHAKEICQVLSDKIVAIGGFDLCISVLNVLEEFWLRHLLWGVWCGLVCCYKVHLMSIDKNNLTRIEATFFRKLRGIAVNFELDRDLLHKDCLKEVEKHIEILDIKCLCPSVFKPREPHVIGKEVSCVEPMEVEKNPQPLPHGISKENERGLTPFYGRFKALASCRKGPRMTEILKHDLIKTILQNIDLNSGNFLFDCLFGFQFLKTVQPIDVSLHLKASLERKKKELNVILTNLNFKTKAPSPVLQNQNSLVPYKAYQNGQTNKVKKKEEEQEDEQEVISTPKTRSKRRAEEEERRKELENHRRRKRKSFEILVQEIVRKNKERKTEKNSRVRSPVTGRGKKNNRRVQKTGNGNRPVNKMKSDIKPGGFERNLRNLKEEGKKEKSEKAEVKKSFKTDGKLENYFKVIEKKSGSEKRKEEKKSMKRKKEKGKKAEGKENSCCNGEKNEGERKGEIGWRQTSLKTMMNRKSKTTKVKIETRTRSKTGVCNEEKPKVKKESKGTDSPLSKLCPFKKVFHDHEYAKIEPQDLETFQRVFLARQEKATDEITKKAKSKDEKLKKRKRTNQAKPDSDVKESSEFPETKTQMKRLESLTEEVEESPKVESVARSELPEADPTDADECKVLEKPGADEEKVETEMLSEANSAEMENPRTIVDDIEENKSEATSAELSSGKSPDVLTTNIFVQKESPEEYTELFENRTKGSRKRIRITDSLKRCKRIKLEEENLQEEKLPLEITEKENLEEKQSITPTKKATTGCSVPKSEGSPKMTNGMISSRALRMIALVPESTTKTGQVQWETSPRVETGKCKKVPNVDRNSRASKMLALISGNVTEVEEDDAEETNGSKGLTSTPNTKTPASSLKSPMSIKKRRSIRFDDTKNETVLYKTDTPPSQILEEKEKCRRNTAAES